MSYVLRPLKTKDMFALSRIIKSMNLQFTFSDQMSTEQIGMEIVTKVIENVGAAEKEVVAFIADLAGMTPQAFSDLPLEESFAIISQLKDIPGVTGFFTSATKQANL